MGVVLVLGVGVMYNSGVWSVQEYSEVRRCTKVGVVSCLKGLRVRVRGQGGSDYSCDFRT